MRLINTLFGIPLGYLMSFCFDLLGNYGMAIILFTLLTKALMFPLSLISQKNALTMARIQPALNDIKQRNFGNSALIIEEQKALYKKEGYSTLKSLLPLLAQIPIILGLINVIYNPLQHLLRLDAQTIQALLERSEAYLQVSAGSLGSGGPLKVMELVQTDPSFFSDLAGVPAILGMDTGFLGTNLTHIPTVSSLTLLYPVFSGASALALAVYQDKHYILQEGQGAVRKWAVTIFLVLFSFFFAYVLPCGVGLYWTVGNLLSILVLALSNRIYDPSPYREGLVGENRIKKTREEKREARLIKKTKARRQREDRKRFNAIPGKQLVFYSEGSGFYKYFEGFIEYILEHSDLVIHYVTNDLDDQIFSHPNPRLIGYYIGPLATISFMMRMDADMVVMTTPDLENFHIKRSLVRKDIEYVFIDHGMTSFHIGYRKDALDHFDTIFCHGANNIAEVREMEALYGLPAKNLVKTGYPLLDSMLKEVEALGPVRNIPRIILIAPSWQNDNLLEFCFEELMEALLRTDCRIVVRPHPEFIKRFPGKMQALQESYAHLPESRLYFQTDFSPNDTVYTADLVITDWSSIAQDFSYATKKPSLFINTPIKILNPEYDKISIVPLDISLRDELGVSLDPGELDRLPAVIEDLFDREKDWTDHIDHVLHENIYDVGDGSRAGGEYIISRLKEKGLPKEDPASDTSLRLLGQALDREDPHIRSLLDQPFPEDRPPWATHKDYLDWLARTLEEERHA